MNSIDLHTVTLTVNGTPYTRSVEARMLLSDFLRHELELTGTHVGCEHGSCGACTVILDGEAVRSCCMFAVQVDGSTIITVEGLAPEPGVLHPLQEAFREKHGLQCGYCTPGILCTLIPELEAHRASGATLTEAEVRELLSGNICRCTGYQNIVDAALYAAKQSLTAD